jgi:hypothetical protein
MKNLMVEIAFFKPQYIKLKCKGIWEAINFSLPRKLEKDVEISPEDSIKQAIEEKIISV